MKKVLLFVNMLLLLATAVKAQIPQYSISASVPTALGSDAPFRSYPAGSRVQWLFLNSQFPTAPTGFITKIYVKSNTATVNATYTNLVIKIGQTTATTLGTTFVTAGMTVALSDPLYVIPSTTVNGWVEIPLYTPIPYDATQNLIVEVAHDGFINGFNQRHGSIAARRTVGVNPALTGTVDTYNPDFGFNIAFTCNKIDYTTIQKNNITTTSADISWGVPGPSTTAYEYQLDQNPLDPGLTPGFITTTSPSHSFTGLTPGTCYYVHLRTNCDPALSLINQDTSGWVTDSFCTLVDCVAPEVTIDRVTGTTAVATWAAVPGVLYYEYSTGVNPVPPIKGHTTTYTSVKLLGLTPNSPLYFHLRAFCSPVPVSNWGSTPYHTMWSLSADDITANKNAVIEAYPNPVADVLNLRINGAKDATLTISDITGKVLSNYTDLTEAMQLNMKDMPSGIYLIRYSSSSATEVIRVNKQ